MCCGPSLRLGRSAASSVDEALVDGLGDETEPVPEHAEVVPLGLVMKLRVMPAAAPLAVIMRSTGSSLCSMSQRITSRCQSGYSPKSDGMPPGFAVTFSFAIVSQPI